MSPAGTDPADPSADPAADAILRDLVDAAVQEGLVPVIAPSAAGGWGRVGGLWARLREGGALQSWRLVSGPLLDDDGNATAPGDAVAALGLVGPGAAALAADVATAHRHAAVLDIARSGATVRPRPGQLLPGERLAATRGRPFHPTGRAVSGWSPAELAELGPMRTEPLAPSWVAVRRDRLRHGPEEASGRLHETVLSPAERDALHESMARARTGADTHQPLPVHPWQAAHVLPTEFAGETARGEVTPLLAGLGRCRPTASLRTLAIDTADAVDRHLKLPLGVATLGAARLLPPRYLDNADRAERTARAVVAADPVLAGLVGLCAEGCWAGWSDGDDEFADRPGHLAAQVRTYPPSPAEVTAVPMAALAADAWDVLGPALGVDDPVAFFGGLADAFTTVVLSFLAHGVLPEIHGQNVVVQVAPGAAIAGFVLRDHDTLRLFPPWMSAAGVPDPGYRIRPGAHQSLRLDAATDLVGYGQTLGFQVNLYGIADALARHHDLDERVLWARLGQAVEHALDTLELPSPVATVVGGALLRAEEWPSRTVLGPLLASGPSSSVSMPAGSGRVPNPLLAAAPVPLPTVGSTPEVHR